MPSVTLLGPQRLRPIVKPVLDEREIDGPLAVITGGWEEREDEVDDLRDHCQRETLNLGLHRRMEAVLNEDRALSQALTDRNDRLRVAQTFYQRRLAPLLDSVRRLHQLKVSRMELLPAERAHALLSVAELDAHYMTQIRGIHAAFQELWDPVARPAVVAAREELRELLAGSSALLIAGGHVGVLLDQLTLFELSSIVGDTPIVAWSAGAMVLCERIVLFHDSPPRAPATPRSTTTGWAWPRRSWPCPTRARDSSSATRSACRSSPAASPPPPAWPSTRAAGSTGTGRPGPRSARRAG